MNAKSLNIDPTKAIRIDIAKDATSAGINELLGDGTMFYLSDLAVKSFKTIRIPTIDDKWNTEERQNLNLAYTEMMEVGNENFKGDKGFDNFLKLASVITSFGTEKKEDATSINLIQQVKKGSGIFIKFKIDDEKQIILEHVVNGVDAVTTVKDEVDTVKRNMPFVCTYRNASGTVGTFTLGRLLYPDSPFDAAHEMTLAYSEFKIQNFLRNDEKVEWIKFQNISGITEEINQDEEIQADSEGGDVPNFSDKLTVYGAGPKGFGSGALNLTFKNSKDYTLTLRSSTLKEHTKKFSVAGRAADILTLDWRIV